MFTGRPVEAAAMSRSVCRQRKAGIWMMSRTAGGRLDLGRLVDVGQDRDADRPLDLGQDVEAFFQPGAAEGPIRRSGWPCRRRP